MASAVKRRVTVSLDPTLLQAVDRLKGPSRSEKIERLVAVALASDAHRRWVSELKAFYESDAAKAGREEDLAWMRTYGEAMWRDD